MIIPWADINLGACRAMPPRLLRQVVCAELERLGGAHVDWHGHASGGTTRSTPAPICYREGGRIYLVGPRTPERLAELLRLSALRDPAGGVHDVSTLRVESGETLVSTSNKRWRAYRLATPYYPTTVQDGRRPPGGPFLAAWAGRCVATSIGDLMADWDPRLADVYSDVHVQISRMDLVPVEWARPVRGDHARGTGFVAELVTNANLPDGVGLGQHRAEGFGELRRIG